MIAQKSEPTGVEHDTVEGITMRYQQQPSIRSFVNFFAREGYSAETETRIITKHLVMIANYENNPRTLGGDLQYTARTGDWR